MSEQFVFSKHPSLVEVEAIAKTPLGKLAAAEIHADFASIAQVLSDTCNNKQGNAVIHVPGGDTITLVNVSTAQLTKLVAPYESLIDRTFF